MEQSYGHKTILVVVLWTHVIFCVYAQCSNFNTVELAQAACAGTFEAYPVNGTKVPYKCSTCGSGLICGGAVCPPVISDRGVFNSTPCTSPYVSATNDYSCTALQKHCEDTGNGFLVYARVFFYSTGSGYTCSGCSSGSVEVASELEDGDHPDGALEQSFDSGILIVLYISIIGLFIAGLVIEFIGRRQQDGTLSGSEVLTSQINWQMKRFCLLIDAHGRNMSFMKAVFGQAVFFKFFLLYLTCIERVLGAVCCCKNEQVVQSVEEERKGLDRRFDYTYATVVTFVSIALATMLSGATKIFITCELVYPGVSSLPPILGFVDVGSLDPFVSVLLPEDTLTTYPDLLENVNGVFTIGNALNNGQLGPVVLLEFILEEIMILAALIAVEQFAIGCGEMEEWNQKRIHYSLRGCAFLYMVVAIAVHQGNFAGIEASLAVGYILFNLFFAILVLSGLLIFLAVPRRLVGNLVFGTPETEFEYPNLLKLYRCSSCPCLFAYTEYQERERERENSKMESYY